MTTLTRTRILALTPALLAAMPLAAQTTTDGLLAAPWRAYSVGDYPNFTASALDYGDVNGDGHPDVVVGRDFFGGPGISVLIHDGNDGYLPPAVYSSGYNNSILDVELADFDGDGDLDVYAAMPDSFGESAQIQIWHNNGSGSFPTRRIFATGRGPTSIVVDDFNGDGRPDVLSADADNFNQGTFISLLLHNGLNGSQAGFQPRRSFQTNVPVRNVVADDIDGDGDLDVLVGGVYSIGNPLGNAILFNDGAGNFSVPTHYVAVPGTETYLYQSTEVALGDTNGDGAPDLIASGAYNGIPNYGLVTIRLNNGSGAFGDAVRYELPDWSYLPDSLTVADLNEDGRLDIIATTPSGRAGEGFCVLLNEGGGAFSTTQERYESAKWTVDAASFDVDGDGHLDIVTAANDSSVITVHPGDGSGLFHVHPRFETGFLAGGMDFGDIDLDGDMDIALSADSDVQLLFNDGLGNFGAPVEVESPFIGGELKLRDLNNDGYLDIILGPNRNYPPYNFATSVNNGDGTFGPFVVTLIGASQAGSIDAFDLNNDGFLDITLCDPGPASCIHLARNTGNGVNFVVQPRLDTEGLPGGLAGADLDKDGNIDLVTNDASGISVYPGNGDFTFNDHVPTGVPASRFVLAFMDGDLNEDLVLIDAQDSFGNVFISTMLGFGDTSFGFPDQYIGPAGREGAFRIASDIAAADLTGDGLLDVLLTSNAPNDLTIYPGNGDGSLQPYQRYGVGYSPKFSAVADFDGDGVNDVGSLISLLPSGLNEALVLTKGLAIPEEGLQLSQSDLHRGQVATFTLEGATAGETVYFAYSLVGVGAGPCPPALGGLCLDLLNPVQLIGNATADGSGRAVLAEMIPANAPLRNVYTQAVVRRGSGGADSEKSNTVTALILP